MKIAIVQTTPVKGDIEMNLNAHIQWIKEAVALGSELIVFPELSLTGYEPELATSLAISPNDTRLDCLQVLSDEGKIAIGVGVPTRQKDGINVSMILFRPGEERLTYSKQYLYHTEVSVFIAGNSPLVLNFGDEIVAPAICYELSNEEHHQYAVRNNATVYIASVLNSFNGVDSDLKKLSDIARTYKMTTFMANYVGISGGHSCAGRSTVWNSKGEVVKQLGDREEGMIAYDTRSGEVAVV